MLPSALASAATQTLISPHNVRNLIATSDLCLSKQCWHMQEKVISSGIYIYGAVMKRPQMAILLGLETLQFRWTLNSSDALGFWGCSWWLKQESSTGNKGRDCVATLGPLQCALPTQHGLDSLTAVVPPLTSPCPHRMFTFPLTFIKQAYKVTDSIAASLGMFLCSHSALLCPPPMLLPFLALEGFSSPRPELYLQREQGIFWCCSCLF